jgi:hypothetical protein
MDGWEVLIERRDGTWRAVLLDPSGAEVLDRPCGSEEEARLFASTVEQHLGWLSEARFREYYRLP